MMFSSGPSLLSEVVVHAMIRLHGLLGYGRTCPMHGLLTRPGAAAVPAAPDQAARAVARAATTMPSPARGTGVSVTRRSPKPQRQVRFLGPPLCRRAAPPAAPGA